ncbi:hypothetical protein HYC85_013037 [Camellia sinensis]|uniref:Uncharacterized protein n=1 Tax=Camellia sinensis TaxID=4442 RepID=A0A7J7HGF3_CAMSI|nr:hypothetical protein HYC85_013037 [Camellia sinensis]
MVRMTKPEEGSIREDMRAASWSTESKGKKSSSSKNVGQAVLAGECETEEHRQGGP